MKIVKIDEFVCIAFVRRCTHNGSMSMLRNECDVTKGKHKKNIKNKEFHGTYDIRMDEFDAYTFVRCCIYLYNA